MKKFIIFIILILVCFQTAKPSIPYFHKMDEKAYIPNNISYGTPTKGGKGGKIIKVTNLAANGSGSFVEALSTKGPRIIVFEVAGVIDLNKQKIRINEPFLTIAGQTAPSPGLTIIKGEIGINTHDVIIQHLHIRPGGDAEQGKKSGFEPDGVSTIGANAYKIIIDHCSITWAVDENLSASGGMEGTSSTSKKITFSNNIIAEGLMKSSHSKGNHSMGSLIHDFVQDVAIVGNLYASNNRRNPLFKSFTSGCIINNLIYNPGTGAIHMDWSKEELNKWPIPVKNGQISVVGNVLIKGKNSNKKMAMISGKGDVYIYNNLAFDILGNNIPIVSEQLTLLNNKPSWPDNFMPINAEDVNLYIQKHVGARPNDRDEIDRRIINNVINLKGEIINSQTEVGGYPNYKKVFRKLNVPENNIDNWLQEFSNSVE